MSEKVKDTAQAVKGIVEAVPIYEDLLQPTVQELGKGLHTLSKTIHIALAPVSALVWSYDQIKDYITSSLEEKLKHVSKENIIPPDPSVAGPALEAMRYTGHKEELREMFSNLIATAMNSDVASTAHPSFVEIIKQLSSDEAKILKSIKGAFFPTLNVFSVKGIMKSPVLENFSNLAYISECDSPDQILSYLTNLSRLGLIKLYDNNSSLTDKSLYNQLYDYPIVKEAIKLSDLMGESQIVNSHGRSTPFGQQFYEACIK